MSIDRVPELVRRLYEVVGQLEGAFPGRKFSLDGHLVGSIGEVIAADRYGLELLANSTEGHDARCPDGRLIQVKTTQGKSVGLRSQPKHLIVLVLRRDGTVEEAYNGPGHLAWEAAGPMQKNGQRRISISTLRSLKDQVEVSERIPCTTTQQASVTATRFARGG